MSANNAFSRVLVANRGEIACRILRTLRDLGLPSVVVYSEADAPSLAVRLADTAVCIGPAAASDSYLSMGRILDAAHRMGCDAIIPGYGFLSENAEFARECERRSVTFVGPSPHAIEVMGDKLSARDAAAAAGVPLVPGGSANDAADAVATARRVGFPVVLKASAGGGGKGMRQLDDAAALESAFEPASREAERAFGSGRLYVEKAIINPRHVEIQILGDKQGNLVHLFERDCSIQRRHQKIIEETPCPVLSDAVRAQMATVALDLARSVNYFSAGTVEFLLGEDEQFYFLEMNTRLQVEHPITELVTGTDLVQEMLHVAAGGSLSWTQDTLDRRGAAIECRLYAEDPSAGFLPRTGTLKVFRTAGGPYVRTDSGVIEGSQVGSHYDPLLAKVCTWGTNRASALSRMLRALGEMRVDGVTTNLELLTRVLEDDDFRVGHYHTGYLAAHPEQLKRTASPTEVAALAAAAYDTRDQQASRYEYGGRATWAK